jgi:soluble lytic murein transglycosylase
VEGGRGPARQARRPPLEAYPAYWQIAGTIDRAPAAGRPGVPRALSGRPARESLRREWLKALGAAGQWDVFRGEFPKFVGEDAEVTCYALQERLARDDAEAASEARVIFLAGREAPAACEALFNSLAASKRLGPAEAWERIRKCSPPT